MKHIWEYSVSTNTIWASFDYGQVEAETREEALELAKKELETNFDKVNKILEESGTSYSISFDANQIELTKLKLVWTKEDSQLARAEGWDLYNSEGSLYGNIQVQRNDDQGILEVDADAWRIVKTQVLPHHKKALMILKEENVGEYNRIIHLK